MKSTVFRTFLLGSLLLMTACASGRTPAASPELPYPPARTPVIGDILHLPTGLYMSERQMLDIITDARIAYVGETHDNPASHRLELAVLRAMADRWPGRTALGMEMFTPDQQDVLDRWVAGELEEKDFLRQSGWYRQWRMDFTYYRELLQFARERRIPVIGLNAGKELVKEAGQSDWAAMSEEDREKFPEMAADPYHETLVEAIFAGHAHGKSGLPGFQRVQTLWDETMAENIAGFLRDREEMRMVVVAGSNHVRFGFGIPRRAFRRLPTSYALIGSQELQVPEEKKDRLMDVDVPPFPMPPFDFIAFTAYEELPGQKVRLGVQLKETDEGRVQVEKVLPGSAAEQAGIMAGDLLLTMDGQPVADNFDVIYTVQQKQPGGRSDLRLQRGEEVIEIEVIFAAPQGGPHDPR